MRIGLVGVEGVEGVDEHGNAVNTIQNCTHYDEHYRQCVLYVTGTGNVILRQSLC
jgi:hypothetical protein